MNKLLRTLSVLLIAGLILCSQGCAKKEEKETVLIYTSINTNRVAELQVLLNERFPQYNVIVEYQGTSKQTAQLLAEGTDTAVDITHDLAYANIQKLSDAGFLADLSNIVDYNAIMDYLVPASKDYYVECMTGGCFMVNTKVLKEKGLEIPQTYEDLLKPCYKGLISMPDPKSSGTGYMFIKALINAWDDEEKVMDYFKKLSENVLAFTSSGNGPINSIKMEETAIGLGMLPNLVTAINEGATDLIAVFPPEGAPYSAYGQGIIKGKETRQAVVDVFKYLTTEYLELTVEKYAPEKTLKNKDNTIPNFPQNVQYADMSNDTSEEKARLLELWDAKVVK